MAGMTESYTVEVEREIAYLGTWLPGARLRLGDIGRMVDRSFVRETSLSALGMNFEELDESGHPPRDLGVNSGAALSIEAVAAAGGVLPHGVRAQAGVEITFRRRNSMMMRAEGCRRHQFDRLDLVKREILAVHLRGGWEEEWVVVTEVQEAERLLVLIARKSGATAQLDLGAGLGPSAMSLAGGSGRVGLVKASSSVFNVADDDATPLFRAHHVAPHLLAPASVEPADGRGRARAAAEDDVVVEFRF